MNMLIICEHFAMSSLQSFHTTIHIKQDFEAAVCVGVMAGIDLGMQYMTLRKSAGLACGAPDLPNIT